MIKAIIFDMDGVLIDAKEWHYEALNRALRLFGFEISRHDHLTTFDGLPTKKKLEMLSLEKNLPRGLHNFINELKQLYTMELVYLRCRPRFIHEHALARLRKMGYRLALASNSIRSTVDAMMQKSALGHHMEFTLSNEDVATPKPSPEIYTVAIQKLGLSPEECLIVEDNENGIRAAKASGAHVMVVRDVDEVNFHTILQTIKSLDNK